MESAHDVRRPPMIAEPYPRIRILARLGLLASVLWLAACGEVTNIPYAAGAERTNTFFTAFQERSPRYLDPTASYNLDESRTPTPSTSRRTASTT